MTDMWKNKLYYGDNLNIMREHIKDESVDLIYLDPPFNSKATYNILFKEKNGTDSTAQITAFEDTWHWNIESERTYKELVTQCPIKKLSDLIQAMRSFLGTNDMMAYLTMMAIRLVEIHRVSKQTGSIYLHCDPTASHYLKLVMDAIFGAKNFRNEIVWCYKERERVLPFWNPKHDIILFYLKNNKEKQIFNWQIVAENYSAVTLAKFKYKDKKGHYQIRGRNVKNSPIKAADGLTPDHEKKYPGLTYRDYLESRPGVPPRDWWSINIINKASKERLGYPTQKPEKLLERIIKASSNEGDIVFDPFCGCGTTVSVAEKLHRKWIGIDITHLAISLMKHRLESAYGEELSPYEIIGDPKDLSSAQALSQQDKYQFEWWALSLVGARPAQDKKKGADKGIDGYIYFFDDESGKAKKIIVQVKGGHVSVSQIRDFAHVIEREKASLGVFITLNEPTKPMKTEAVGIGFYDAPNEKQYPKLQIVTIQELLSGKTIERPYGVDITHKKAQRVSKRKTSEQTRMDI